MHSFIDERDDATLKRVDGNPLKTVGSGTWDHEEALRGKWYENNRSVELAWTSRLGALYRGHKKAIHQRS